MGSGCFPLEGPLGQRLLAAAREVEDVKNALVSDVYSGESGGQQFDNTADDGGSLALLGLAVRLIRDAARWKGGI